MLATVLLSGPPAFALDVQALEQKAASGDAEALFQLADFYERGDQVEQDLQRAARLLQAAADRGHASAQYRLGLAQAAGVGTERDPVQSYAWLTLAANKAGPTSLLAKSLLEVVKGDLAPQQLAEAEDRAAAFAPVAGPLDLPRPTDVKALAVSGSDLPVPETDCGRLEVASDSGRSGSDRRSGCERIAHGCRSRAHAGRHTWPAVRPAARRGRTCPLYRDRGLGERHRRDRCAAGAQVAQRGRHDNGQLSRGGASRDRARPAGRGATCVLGLLHA